MRLSLMSAVTMRNRATAPEGDPPPMTALRVLFFHAFHAEADLLSSHINSSGAAEVLPISPLVPPSSDIAKSVETVLVSRISLQRWFDFEAALPFKFTVPRIVMSSWPRPWTQEVLRTAGLDGWAFLDLSLPPRHLIQQVAQLLSDATTKGFAPPLTRHEPSDFPLESDLTMGDDSNTTILRLLAFGLSDRDISSAMNLSPRTIRNRVSHMLRSNGFESRTAIALFYLRQQRLRLQQDHNRTTASPPP